MDRVNKAAESLRNEGLIVETWKGFLPPLLRTEAKNVAYNVQWINQMIHEGYSVIDIGLETVWTSEWMTNAGAFEFGPYYGAEIKATWDAGLKTDWLWSKMH
jgi:hypothetical protein